jgi:nucleotide-binding universal stress UspA family protein
MYKQILIATDGSELAQKAVQQGLDLAKRLGAVVTIVSVTAPWPIAEAGGVMVTSPIAAYESAVAREAACVLEPVAARARELGVACAKAHVADQYPAEGIIEQAKAKGCDLIVMASHGRRGIARAVLGSQTARVLVLSPVPVLVCK